MTSKMIVYKDRRYRSKLESSVGAVLGPTWAYEPFKVPYVTYRNYSPDFVFTGKDFELLVEVKGFFRPGDTQKYKAIRDALGSNRELVFFLQAAKAKVRKGAKLTMGGWCEKEGLLWFEDPILLKEYVENGHL